jgi:alpha-L-arabinofuranosidase
MSSSSKEKTIQLQDAKAFGRATIISLANADTGMTNSIPHPDHIQPVTTTLAVKGKQINFIAAPYSLTVIKVKIK